jgi:putative ABC transport system substrate-binding protein
MIPTLRRMVAFYNPANPHSRQSVEFARDTARQLKVELLGRRFASLEELRASLRSLPPGKADAIVYVDDATVTSQTAAIMEAPRVKKLPTMIQDPSSVGQGALASYGINLHAVGRLGAKQVQRILQGAAPGDLPVEQLDRLQFTINLKTAKALGLTIPPSVPARADQVSE